MTTQLINLRERVYAASVLSKDQVKHLFAFDISRYYTVVEIAVYPGEGGSLSFHPDSFVVKAAKDKDVVRRTDAMTVAANIQQKNTPKPPSETMPVYTQAHIGYEPEQTRTADGGSMTCMAAREWA